jgi:hypothetical protein
MDNEAATESEPKDVTVPRVAAHSEIHANVPEAKGICKLAELKDAGILSDEEFQSKKKELLNVL